MELSRVVFRNGIEARMLAGRWQLSNCHREDSARTFGTPQEIQALVGSPPVVVEPKLIANSPLLVNPRTGRFFGVEVTELSQGMLRPATIYQVRRLIYGLEAMIYHCTILATLYPRICARMAALSRIPGGTQDPLVLFQGNEEPYFEFDALVTTARRLYDAPSAALWNRFNSRPTDAPHRLEPMLARIDNMPQQVRERITTSWERHGKRARDYRDSIVHWADTEHGFGSVDLFRHEALGTWGALARIPDNPEVKSRVKFTFAQRIDALDCALDLTAELTSFARIVIEAITDDQTPEAPASSSDLL